METSVSDAALDALIPETCWVLLGKKSLGRVAVVVDGDIHVLPVNYALRQGRIILRSGSNSILREAAPCKVTFEVDDIDETARRGWSVSAKGILEEITGVANEDPQLDTNSLDTWAPGSKPLVLEIRTTEVTGRYLYSTPSGTDGGPA